MSFKPALIVVDMQNDFCPPHGSLAVRGGRDIVPLVNELLALRSFVVKVGTKDWHPQKHISFASSHRGPNNKPFDSYVEIGNHVGGKPTELMSQRLWPDHCIQNTRGAEFIDELDSSKFDFVVQKGMDERVEMYSAFMDSFGNMTAGPGSVSHDLAQELKKKEVTDVYVVGLAGNYCVKDTAIGAARAGFNAYVIEEGQRCTDTTGWSDAKNALKKAHVEVISMNSDQAQRFL